MSKYYTSPPQVIDGDVAYARDVNDINNEADAGFASVEADFLSLSGIVQAWAEVAKAWAENPEDTEVEQGAYSALHWASKASASSSSALASKNAAASSEANAAASASSASSSASSAASSEASAATSASSAATSEANAATSEANAASSEVNAASSEANAAASASSASVSASNAASSEANAAASESSASTSAANASSSATSAASSETNAAASAASAATSASNAAASAALVPDPSLGSAGDTILVNETQDGWIFGEGGGGGLSWSVVSADTAAEDLKGYLVDTSVQPLTLTLPSSPTVGMQIGVKDYAGTFDLRSCTIGTSSDKFDGVAGPLVLDSKGFAETLVYSGADKGWLTVTAIPPTTAQSKPMLIAKGLGQRGGAAPAAGDNERNLVIESNEIAGATCVDGVLTLPAGKYYITGASMAKAHASTEYYYHNLYLRDSLDTDVIVGTGARLYNNNTLTKHQTWLRLEKVVTLAGTTSLRLIHHINETGGAGLNAASLGDNSDYTSTLTVVKLDATVETPVVYDSGLYPVPGNAIVTGNMYGLDINYIDTHTVRVEAGICMDSLNSTVLQLATAQDITVPSTANLLTNLFLCDDGVVRLDTDENGSGLSAYKKRWLGPVFTKSDSAVRKFNMRGNRYEFAIIDSIDFVTNPAASTPFTPDYTGFIPLTRVELVGLWGKSTTDNFVYYIADDNYYSRGVQIQPPPKVYAANFQQTEMLWVTPEQKLSASSSYTVGIITIAALKLRR